LRSEIAFSDTLRNHLVEKSITVLGDRFVSIAIHKSRRHPQLNVIARSLCTSQAAQLWSSRSRRSDATVSD